MLEYDGDPITGSGPMNLLKAPFFANSSAYSFPSMFEWAGTHNKSIRLSEARLFSNSQHSKVSADFISTDERAFKAAWLSEQMKMISVTIFDGITAFYDGSYFC